VVGNQCWISGQLSVGDDGIYVAGTAREEAERAFAHVFRIAEAAGFSRSDIVYVDLAFIDLADVKEVNALYASLFAEGQRPARTIYQAAKLPFGGKIKVQAVAARA
jgi:2-iminobutanoate/2-iminopropanoate deaminase